ncbi:MAG TPA: Sua5/YciO/YrdC/YwlC family protein [Pirellulaceae bacterium]|nr:Sua5/YciO/YrdC/YwlC family protein [Pirellulaceae bacterium]
MAPLVLDVTAAEDPSDAVHRAVQALVEGKVVALPTETVYIAAASALSESAVQRLLNLRSGQLEGPATLAVRSTEEVLDYVPQLPPIGQRLARRCWPGPVTMQLADAHPDSAIHRLPKQSRAAIVPGGQIQVRVPAHELVLRILRLLKGPVVMVGARYANDPDAVTAADVVSRLGEHVDVVLDDGRCKFAQRSSIVRVNDHGFEVLRPGVLSEANLKRLASLMIVLVCTGNTCRSPMAEVLLKKQIAERLGCRMEELDDRGVVVMSAGTSAAPGGRAAPEAIQAMQGRGLDLTQHESQPISSRVVRFADLILTMTKSHRDAIVGQWPDAEPRVFTLSPGNDISDPVGGPLELYRRCADQLDASLADWVDKLPLGES